MPGQNEAIMAPQTPSFTSITQNAMNRTRIPLSTSGGGLSPRDIQQSQASSQQHAEAMQKQRLDESSRRFDQRLQIMRHNQDRMFKEYQRGRASYDAYRNRALELPQKSYHQRDVWKTQHDMKMQILEQNHANLGAATAALQAMGNGKTPADIIAWNGQRVERIKQFDDASNALSSGVTGSEKIQDLNDDAYGNFVTDNFNARISQDLENWTLGPSGAVPSMDASEAAIQLKALRKIQSDLITRTYTRGGATNKGLLDKGWLDELDKQDQAPGADFGRIGLLNNPTVTVTGADGSPEIEVRRPIRTRQELDAFANDATILVTPADRVAYKALLDEYDAWASKNGKIPAGNPKVKAILGRISSILTAADQKMGDARMAYFQAMRKGRGGAKSLTDEERWLNATWFRMNPAAFTGQLAREFGALPVGATDDIKGQAVQSVLQKVIDSIQQIQPPGAAQQGPAFP